MQWELQAGNAQLRPGESGRLLEEGTPELVLKEEQGLVKPEGGSLADEMGSDAGWPVTQKDRQQKPVGGNEDWPRARTSLQVLRRGLKMLTTQKSAPALAGLAFSWHSAGSGTLELTDLESHWISSLTVR